MKNTSILIAFLFLGTFVSPLFSQVDSLQNKEKIEKTKTPKLSKSERYKEVGAFITAGAISKGFRDFRWDKPFDGLRTDDYSLSLRLQNRKKHDKYFRFDASFIALNVGDFGPNQIAFAFNFATEKRRAITRNNKLLFTRGFGYGIYANNYASNIVGSGFISPYYGLYGIRFAPNFGLIYNMRKNFFLNFELSVPSVNLEVIETGGVNIRLTTSFNTLSAARLGLFYRFQ
jgi:hypothetical protein